MTPNELGQVFGLLLRHREIQGNPTGRPLREGELSAANLLANCSELDLTYVDEFLAAQGFSLYIRDALDLGIPAKQGRPNKIYVLIRKRGEEVAPYIDQGWFLNRMKDGRSSAKKADIIFWTVRLWLTMQWFFYNRIDRLPSEVGRYWDALISERLFVQTLSEGIERLGNEGRPDGEAGVMWDALWGGKKNLQNYATRFLRVMEEGGMIQDAGNPGEYRQTVVAAIDMAAIAENELTYLMPAGSEANIFNRSMDLLMGETYTEQEQQGEDDNASHQAD